MHHFGAAGILCAICDGGLLRPPFSFRLAEKKTVAPRQKKRRLFAGLAGGRTGGFPDDLESLRQKISAFCRVRYTSHLKSCVPALLTAE